MDLHSSKTRRKIGYLNKRCVREKPLILVRCSSLFRRVESPSAHMRKRQGKSESPCLIPLFGLKLSLSVPLINTEYSTDSMHFITQLLHFSLNLIWVIILSRSILPRHKLCSFYPVTTIVSFFSLFDITSAWLYNFGFFFLKTNVIGQIIIYLYNLVIFLDTFLMQLFKNIYIGKLTFLIPLFFRSSAYDP